MECCLSISPTSMRRTSRNVYVAYCINISLRKKGLVTRIFFSGENLTVHAKITANINMLLPTRELTYRMMPPSSAPYSAAMAANTSGAPLPKASKVTPASDCEHDSMSDSTSTAGDK